MLSVGQINWWRWTHSVSQGIAESSSVAVTQREEKREGCRKKQKMKGQVGKVRLQLLDDCYFIGSRCSRCSDWATDVLAALVG